jgi:predicted permease
MMFLKLLDRLLARLRHRDLDSEAHAELRFHLDMQTQANLASGMTPSEARRGALRAFGGIEQAREAVRDQRATCLDQVWQDVRFAWRQARRTPGFTATAVVTLALGIGANVAIFSVVDAALFRPLPYRDADRLVNLFVTVQTRAGGQTQIEVTGRHLDDLRAIRQVFEGVDAFDDYSPKALATGFDASPLVGAITPTFPAFLGVTPQLGRAFTQDDVIASDRVIISDGYWQRAFNRDREVIGKTIAFSDQACVVVGVMPPTFRYFVGAQTDAWLPLAERNGDRLAARIRPGMTLAQAQRELNAALARPGSTWKPVAVEIAPAEWNRGADSSSSAGSTRMMLFSLLGAMGFVLVIACANVANLLLSRSFTRQREIAVRGSLGATRFQLVRQFLIEGLVLAGLGGVAATMLAWWVIRAIPAIVPARLTYSVLGASMPQLDMRVLAFGCLAAVLTGVLCGAVPAFRATRCSAADGLLAGGQSVAGPTRGQRRTRDAFQTLQVAMTMILLVGAGLLLASVIRMVTVPMGYDPEDLGCAYLTFPRTANARPDDRRAFFDELVARIAAVPGIRAATVGQSPVSGHTGHQFLPEQRDGLAAKAAPLEQFEVRPAYFRVAGIPLREGRMFGPEDGPNAPPVAIISENAARRFWPGRSAIGQRFTWSPGQPLLTVVGVVPHIKTHALARDGVEAYLPVAQTGEPSSLLFRVSGEPAPVIAAIRAAIRSIDPRVTVSRITMVDSLFAEFDPIGSLRFYALLLGAGAGLGLVMAAVGLYGLLSYSVSRRTREIGVRIALGAGMWRVRRLVVVEGLVPIAVGITVGLVAATWLSQLVASQLFQVKPHDPVLLGAIVILFVLVCAVAAFVPVRRATRVDPAEALRTE